MDERSRPELWEDIPGYEGLYKVSSLGRVMALTFVNNQCAGKPWNHIMKPFDNGNGYLSVSLTKDGRRKNYYVHRLVASVFVDNPMGFSEVNHLDHDKANNSAENLEWCNRRHNVGYSSTLMRHPKRTAKPSATGEKYIHKKRGRFRVAIKHLHIDRSFDTLVAAVSFRNGVIL